MPETITFKGLVKFTVTPAEGCRQAAIAIQRCELIPFVEAGANEKVKIITILKSVLIVSLINIMGEKRH